jgi:hypothetical protein
MNISTDDEAAYEKANSQRENHLVAILRSPSPKKIVVGGPGTGKTHLFKKILDAKKKTLTLTFVNSLVEDLSLDLYGMSDVKTLHSFARGILHSITKQNIEIFPKLPIVIHEDAKVLLEQEIDFNKLFHERRDDSEYIDFYQKRRKYYEHYGYSDIVFAAVKYFEQHIDQIPAYEQIVVDEFQDFNALEVSLIDLLAQKSPILLAGDDDQALYDFKSASPKHIRERHSRGKPNHDSFNLPYCSRCTQVVVGATNDIITVARKRGFLKGRIDKPYTYFNHKDKDAESVKYPKIGYKHMYAAQIPSFIEIKIGEMANDLKGKFSTLIISPTRVQSRSIVSALKAKGFGNIEFTERRDEGELNLLDGFKLLLEDNQSNLGWRIVARYFLENEAFNSFLGETAANNSKRAIDIIDSASKRDVKKLLKTLRCIRDDKPAPSDEVEDALNRLKLNPIEIAQKILIEEIASNVQRIGGQGIRKIPIRATTVQSSKGLSADLVFITHFDDQFFIKNKDKQNIMDRDICSFVVALTRTIKRVYLISTIKAFPTFLTWISKERIERL